MSADIVARTMLVGESGNLENGHFWVMENTPTITNVVNNTLAIIPPSDILGYDIPYLSGSGNSYATRPNFSNEELDKMVKRFLTWEVPADVYPDGTPGKPGRTGTNLMNAQQAKEMLMHVLGM